jgi:hypothetical protein
VQAAFFDSTQTAQASAAILAVANDPFGWGIPDGTCANTPPNPSPQPNLPAPLSVGSALDFRVNGTSILNAGFSGGAYAGGSSSTLYAPTFLNPGIEVFVIDSLTAGGQVDVGAIQAPPLPDALKAPINIPRSADWTVNFGTVTAFDASTRVILDAGSFFCASSIGKGSITVPQARLASLPAGPHRFTFSLSGGFLLPLSGVSFSAGTRMPYPSTDGVFVFRFLSFATGGVLN